MIRLAKPEQLCSQLKKDGSRCGAVKLRGRDVCLYHAPDRAQPGKQPRPVDPTDLLSELAALDFSDPANLSRLRKGLIEHVMAGSLGQAEASAVLRIAREESEASPKVKSTGFAAALSKVIESTPPQPE